MMECLLETSSQWIALLAVFIVVVTFRRSRCAWNPAHIHFSFVLIACQRWGRIGYTRSSWSWTAEAMKSVVLSVDVRLVEVQKQAANTLRHCVMPWRSSLDWDSFRIFLLAQTSCKLGTSPDPESCSQYQWRTYVHESTKSCHQRYDPLRKHGLSLIPVLKLWEHTIQKHPNILDAVCFR